MEVQLSPDQNALARHAIENGRIHQEGDVVDEALELWENRERTRAEILAMVDSAEVALAQGAGRVITERSMFDLADEVSGRGRVRLTAERAARS